MDIITLCFAFLGIALIIFFVRKTKEEFAPLISIAAAIVFFGVIIKLFAPIYEEIRLLCSFAHESAYISTLLKSLGIAGATRLCADICRDCGENAVANKLEAMGKIGIVALSLPFLKSVIEIINGLV